MFGFFAGSLLAQDELQALEMPSLARVREVLLERGESAHARTRESGVPTPVLCINVPRLGELDVSDPNCPLYGNKFRSGDFCLFSSFISISISISFKIDFYLNY